MNRWKILSIIIQCQSTDLSSTYDKYLLELEENAKQPKCPEKKEKAKAIREALEYFGMV